MSEVVTDSSTSPLEGEVIGYDLIAFYASCVTALTECKTSGHLPHRYYTFLTTLLANWMQQCQMQGVQHINID